MSTVFFPTGVDAQGNETVIYVPTLADPTAPTVAELTGAGAIDLSCALRGFEPQAEQGSTQDIRLCSRETFENPGRINRSINDITYVYDPQAASGAAGNKHYEALEEGTIGYLVDRRGLDARTAAVATGQKVDVYPVKLGAQRRVPVDPSTEGSKFEIMQKPFVTGPVILDAVVA